MSVNSAPQDSAKQASGSPARGVFGWVRVLIVGDTAAELSQSDKDLVTTSGLLLALCVAGVLATAIWAGSRSGNVLLSFSTGALFIGAAGLIGGVVGLLFGVPRSIGESAAAPPSATDEKPNGQVQRKPVLATNTNLQEISDWLTKIIVGVGLVEAKQIASAFYRLTTAAAKALPLLPGEDAGMLQAIAGCLIIYGLSLGFLCGFLLSRLFLSLAFARVERGMSEVDRLRSEKEQLTKTVEKVESEKAELSQTVKVVTQQKDELTNSVAEAARAQSEVFDLLYHEPPGGFTSALTRLDELLKQDINASNPALWTYYACANGQAYAWALSHGKTADDPDAQQYRAEALKGIENVIRFGPTWKSALQQVWDKNLSSKRNGGAGRSENDLEVFYDDPEFEKLLGPKK
jgi:hypothetical protein